MSDTTLKITKVAPNAVRSLFRCGAQRIHQTSSGRSLIVTWNNRRRPNWSRLRGTRPSHWIRYENRLDICDMFHLWRAKGRNYRNDGFNYDNYRLTGNHRDWTVSPIKIHLILFPEPSGYSWYPRIYVLLRAKFLSITPGVIRRFYTQSSSKRATRTNTPSVSPPRHGETPRHKTYVRHYETEIVLSGHV